MYNLNDMSKKHFAVKKFALKTFLMIKCNKTKTSIKTKTIIVVCIT